MELDHVQAPAEAVVRAQARTIAVRVEAEPQQLATGKPAVSAQLPAVRRRALALDGLAQCDVIRPEIARGEIRRLVFDFVRLEWRGHRRLLPVQAVTVAR